MFRKGEKSGADAWILVLLITVSMIVYVLFLPDVVREDIFKNGELGEPRVTPTEFETGEILLEKHVGRLEFYPPGPIEHPLTSVHLFRTTRSSSIEEYNPFSVEKAIFSGEPISKTFSLQNLDNVDNVLLTFGSPIREGRLSIYLNGQLLSQIQPTRGAIAPLTLKRSLLQKENTLTFEVSSPGWKIWSVNTWQIENARVLADLSDPSKQSAFTTLTMSPVEQRNALSAKLRFTASCDPFAVGPVEIMINGKRIYQAIPDCETVNVANVDPSALIEGTNNVVFRALDGEYRLDNMELVTELKDVHTFVEYFEVNPELHNAVLTGGNDVFLEIEFVDDGERKRAALNVNQHVSRIDQREPFYARNLNNWVEPGFRNYIELVPESPLNIVDVRVVVR
ncbi:MAG: hypothetical protein ACE5FT_03245 [Candidatus Nanoarchaeia archaeon]